MIDDGDGCEMVCRVTGEKECAVIRIGMCLWDELRKVVEEDLPQEWAKDTALLRACADRVLKRRVNVHHHAEIFSIPSNLGGR